MITLNFSNECNADNNYQKTHIFRILQCSTFKKGSHFSLVTIPNKTRDTQNSELICLISFGFFPPKHFPYFFSQLHLTFLI